MLYPVFGAPLGGKKLRRRSGSEMRIRNRIVILRKQSKRLNVKEQIPDNKA